MVTEEQEKWLEHLSATDSVKILPADPNAPQKFKQIEGKIQKALGGIPVFHRGASSLGISGQGELDIYIPVSPEVFDSTALALRNLFGEPRSVYPLDRVAFVTSIEDTKAEVFVINEEGQNWTRSSQFEEYLRAHSEALEEYRILKEEGNGLSTQAYYRKKIEFINQIVEKSNRIDSHETP